MVRCERMIKFNNSRWTGCVQRNNSHGLIASTKPKLAEAPACLSPSQMKALLIFQPPSKGKPQSTRQHDSRYKNDKEYLLPSSPPLNDSPHRTQKPNSA